jgi:hypothetical protein
MIVLLMLPFLFGNFVQKWVIPRGMMGEAGRLLIGDSDRDGNYEFYITPCGMSQKICIYELHLPDTWEVDSFSYFLSPLVWDIGDFDLDGLHDLTIQTAVDARPIWFISIAESPDSFSFPTQEVWRDTVGPWLISPICAYDIDQDGLPEIVKIQGDYSNFYIYESVGDNMYVKVFTDTMPQWGPLSTVAFGDFDSDNQNEFVAGNLGGYYGIYECTGDNSYQQILVQLLQASNIKDCFSVPDADGDGKREFVAKGYVPSTASIYAFILEATGDNTYEVIKYFNLPGGDYYGGYSEAGDVDGDSVPEIVLEARQNVFIIKAAGNDSFYVWDTLPGNNSGSSVRVYDIDGNGFSEVIISGNDMTRIYEYEVGIAEESACDVQGIGLAISPNPFSNSTDIRCQLTDTIRKYELKIYDIAGRLVTDLSQQISVTGNRASVRWDGRDQYGNILPGGVYFLTLTAGNYSTTEKLLLIR